MNPIATAVAGALISGVAVYTVGVNTAFAQSPAHIQTVAEQFVPANSTTAMRPVAVPSVATATPIRETRRNSRRVEARRAPVTNREVVYDDDVREDDRSWGKSAMIIGGGAASGAGVGGIVGGKKGALIGAAIGGGAASIYEATQRR